MYFSLMQEETQPSQNVHLVEGERKPIVTFATAPAQQNLALLTF
jgi:hypothetical protein